MDDSIVQQYNIGNVTNRLLGVVDQRVKLGGVDIIGIPTGFSRIDYYTGGMQNDQLWILAGATGSGKTSAALDVTLNAARFAPDHTAIFFALEMSGEVLVNRLLSRMTDIAASKIIRGQLNGDEHKAVKLAAQELQDLKIDIVDRSSTSNDVAAYCMYRATKAPISMVTIDYAGLLTDAMGNGETERVGKISRNIRNLAKPDQLNVPILLLAQLNRTSQLAETRRPQIHHLKNTSNLEQDAHVILLLYRPSLEQQDRGAAAQVIERDVEIIIGKNREGESGSTKATFKPRLMTWEQ